MDRSFRYLLFGLSLFQGLLGLGFALLIPFVTGIWPMPNTSPLSYIFIGSFFCASAASTLWCLLAGENGSLAGVFLDYVVIFAPMAIYLFLIAGGNGAITSLAIGIAVSFMFGVFGLWWSLRFPIQDPQPQPMPVRIAFAVFVVTLILVGGALALQVPNILPWRITPEGSVIYGLMFLGAASYFIYALLRPSWANSGGQLAGFLAYDLVLILPLINHFSQVSPQLLLNLVLYVVVLVSSSLIAIYYLFVNGSTRVTSRRSNRLEAPDAPASTR